MVVEVMGRHAGWIALYSGLAGGADVIALPEQPTSVEAIAGHVRARAELGRSFSILVVAEGSRIEGLGTSRTSKTDEFGHELLGGIGEQLARRVEEVTGFETRVTVLGHVQRGGTPTAADRVLATRFGVFASELVARREFGKMAALAGNRIVAVDLDAAVAEPKTVPAELYALAELFFG
jgi:6-phosphofructokinase 1